MEALEQAAMSIPAVSTAFLFLLVASAASSLVLAWEAWARRSAPGAPTSIPLMLSLALWAAAYALELTRSGEAARLFWFNARFVGLVLAPVFFHVSAWLYAHDGELPPAGHLFTLAVLVVAEISFAWTNPWHRLLLADGGPVPGGVPLERLRIGYWATVLLACFLLACGTLSLLQRLRRFSTLFAGQALSLVIAVLIPWLTSFLHCLGLFPLGGLDPVPATFTLSAALYAWAIHRFQLFDIVPVAHDRVVHSMPDAVVVLDERDRMVDLNPAAERLLGLPGAGTRGKAAGDVLAAWPQLLQRYREGAENRSEISLDWGRQKRWLELQVSPLSRTRRDGVGRVLVAHDVTERRRMEEALRYSSLHDRLTGLPNRSFLLTRLKSALARSRRRPDSCFALLFLDLDRFKVVNDNLGHFLGDQLLIAVSGKLLACVREPDTVARLGGDEFVILLEEIQSEEDALKVTRRIQETLSAPFTISGHELFTSASVGVAVAGPAYAGVEDILRDADMAMYQAKAGGRSRYAVFRPGMEMRASELQQLESDLRRAVERGELTLRYQPIYSLETGAPVGLEALLRWEHPLRGTVPPAQFLDIAEEAGLMVPIGQQVLRGACRQLASWRRQFPHLPMLSVSVNLSGAELADPALAGTVRGALEESGLPPGALVLEIGEPLLLRTIERDLPALLHLHELGVQLHIDGYGAGYSTFSLLHDLPIGALKIEQAVIQRFLAGDGSAEALRSMVDFGRGLHKSVVVEGIETLQELRRLTGLHCTHGQGYYLSRPLSAPEAEHLLQAAAAPVAGRGRRGRRPQEEKPRRPSPGLSFSGMRGGAPSVSALPRCTGSGSTAGRWSGSS